MKSPVICEISGEVFIVKKVVCHRPRQLDQSQTYPNTFYNILSHHRVLIMSAINEKNAQNRRMPLEWSKVLLVDK